LDGSALILILASTFLHAGWNLIVRRARSETVLVERMLLLIVVVGLIPAAASEAMAHSMNARAWACAAAAGGFCGVYYYGLVRAYRSSDFTVVYPVARALPVLLLAAADVLRGRMPTPLGWAGMSLVVAGCALAPLHSFREAAWRRYVNRASVWIALTALGTVGYTLFDKWAAEGVRPGPGAAGRYGYVFFAVSFAAYALLIRLRPSQPRTPETHSPRWRWPLLAGALNFASYWMVLWAYQMARQTSYIVAFRQFSIPIGVVLAFAMFKEPGRAVRLTGTGLIVVGLVLIALWGR